MIGLNRIFFTLACCLTVSLLANSVVGAQSAKEFYAGKTITMLAGSSAGGGTDQTGAATGAPPRTIHSRKTFDRRRQ
jgi:tripartite-type tricarboxylate transporter receptor subunit TctC